MKTSSTLERKNILYSSLSQSGRSSHYPELHRILKLLMLQQEVQPLLSRLPGGAQEAKGVYRGHRSETEDDGRMAVWSSRWFVLHHDTRRSISIRDEADQKSNVSKKFQLDQNFSYYFYFTFVCALLCFTETHSSCVN